MIFIEADKLIDNLDDMIPADDSSDYVMGIATAIQEVGRMACEDYVEAIPIEWVKKYRNQFETTDDYYNVIDYMLQLWEKENES